MTTLLNLPDELLVEIAAWIPFGGDWHTSISMVNRRFNAVLASRSLPNRIARYQSSDRYNLLESKESDLYTVQDTRIACQRSTNHSVWLQALETVDLSDSTSNTAIEAAMHFQLHHTDAARGRDWSGVARAQLLLNLRVLRLVPIEASLLLRNLHLKVDRSSKQSLPANDQIRAAQRTIKNMRGLPLLTMPPPGDAWVNRRGIPSHSLPVVVLDMPTNSHQPSPATSTYFKSIVGGMDLPLQLAYCTHIFLLETLEARNYIDVTRLPRPDPMVEQQVDDEKLATWTALTEDIDREVTNLFADKARTAILMNNLDLRKFGETVRTINEDIVAMTHDQLVSALEQEHEFYKLLDWPSTMLKLPMRATGQKADEVRHTVSLSFSMG
ncbi:hypothetical protein LTS08_008222 [Lithohypha guttulata]|nr:hypothetical protein LTS08_008222 [Lithohypha guttulata]